MKRDYVIVGSGLTGATIARCLADAGRDVVVLERRSHLGGNVHDQIHAPSGIRFHTYGPHYFRTNSQRLWEYVHRFSDWRPFEAKLLSRVDGQLERWPVCHSYIHKLYPDGWQPTFRGDPQNFEEACLSSWPRLVYEKFIKGYTEKQWGVGCRSLSVDLAGRFAIAVDNDPRLKWHRYQGVPLGGYAALMEGMLRGIEVVSADYDHADPVATAKRRLVYTGSVDALYRCDMGKLQYRTQKREQQWERDVDFVQPVVQVNEPSRDVPYIRTIEWKHIDPTGKGTLLTRETPAWSDKPDTHEYPFPDKVNRELASLYQKRAEADGIIVCGRLGSFKYLDMDQAIGAAMKVAERILDE